MDAYIHSQISKTFLTKGAPVGNMKEKCMEWTCHRPAFISCLHVRGGFGGLHVFHNDTNQALDLASRGTSNLLTSYSQFLIFIITFTAEQKIHQQVMVRELFIEFDLNTRGMDAWIKQIKTKLSF